MNTPLNILISVSIEAKTRKLYNNYLSITGNPTSLIEIIVSASEIGINNNFLDWMCSTNHMINWGKINSY